ncbi:MAG TPA: HAD-IIB family hydrolase [Candidatus Saccharimonadales bacterium]|jgi:hypothetical protein
MKKIIAFDLDDTLAPSKSAVPERTIKLLEKLLEKFDVCVISGGKFDQFYDQLLAKLRLENRLLAKLHIIPTCGTQYYVYDQPSKSWKKLYSEDLSQLQKDKIVAALEKGLDELDLRAEKTYGPTIEDRGSQVTLSVLGQDIVEELGEEGVRLKHEWDPDRTKRGKIKEYVSKLIPEFEVRSGGSTSIDVTMPGIDKAYGMQKLIDQTGVKKDDILFIGDRLQEGGNDYPVVTFGIDSIEINSWQETALVVEAILHVV